MQTQLKKIIFRILGLKTYLKTLNYGFFFMYDFGFLKNNYQYKYHYFVKYLILKNDVVIDIGANLGYFSYIFAQLTKPHGKVIAIEPVKPFFDLLQWRLRHQAHCTCYNYALGNENKLISMTVPDKFGYLRTGLAHVAEPHTEENSKYNFASEMVIGSQLLKDLPKIDYIKCDIEGYEEYVLPELKEIIKKHTPILQVETWGKHKEVVMQLMSELNYTTYCVLKNKLIEHSDDNTEEGDYIFIHKNKEAEILARLKKTDRA